MQTTFPEELSILVVEDEKKIADALKKGLEEQQFHVEAAYDGLIAKRVLENHSFHLVILDVNLPGMNGYELCKFIRSRDEKTPVIMLTALTAINDKLEGFDAGADDYIVKPFDFKELLVRIRALLKRIYQQVQQGNILRVSDVVMNLENKEVSRSGKPISLTAKEFQLLEYLVRNRNRVVSRADIALNVWDIDFDTKTNVIDVYVNFLRKKLDKDFSPKLIHTQVGMGYILKDTV
ncbi:MAG TPA: response regulator transcription factor [Chitinophagaceae bacterium]|jgi:DNA-binding response OmpR family regulator|nr:response regulator transcription factor [Chitinophagaceae bacterium]